MYASLFSLVSGSLSLLLSVLKYVLIYLLLGMFSFYISMFFYYIGLGISFPVSVFTWVSAHFFPVSNFVIVLYYSLIFIILFKFIKNLFFKSS